MLERRALLALSYPRAQDFAESDERSVRALVAWLENMKIRLYPTEERKALEQVDASSAAWDAAFAKYMADLDCPQALVAINNDNSNNTKHAPAVRWLLALALSLDYRDSAAELNAAGAEMEAEAQREDDAAAARVAEAAAQAGQADSGAAAAAAARRRLAARERAFPDLDAPQVRAEIGRMLRMLRLEGGGGVEGGGAEGKGGKAQGKGAGGGGADDSDDEHLLEQQLAAARRAVADEVLPTVGGGSSSSSASTTCASLLADVPLGFATGDARVDQAGALLRLLYLRDLRALQTCVDAAVVEAQEYTANPKTDSSLGRVGR